MNFWKKIKKYLTVFYEEFVYRTVYVLLFSIFTLINMIIFWNEIIIFLLNPLESVLLKNNKIILHEVLIEHYYIEDFNIDKPIKILNQLKYTNEIPYYEINISTFEYIDNLFILIYSYYFLNLVIPYLVYQLILFTTPLFRKHEFYKIVYKIISYYLLVLFFFYIIYYIFMPIFIKSILIATEEIGHYEFEIEFKIENYILQLIKILIIQNIILSCCFFFKKLLLTIYDIICKILLFNLFWNTTIIIFIYYIFLLLVVTNIKNISLYKTLLKYRHCSCLYR